MATSLGILALILWSSLALLAAFVRDISPFFLLAISFFIAFIISIIWRKYSTKQWFSRPRLRSSQWLLGIYGLFGYHFCYFFAIKHAPVLEVSLINYLWPLLLSIFLARKGRKPLAIAGGMIAFFGVYIILSAGQAHFNHEYILGYALALSAAFIWASYSAMLVKRHCELGDIGWISLAVAALSLSCHVAFEPLTYQFQLVDMLIILLIGLGPLGSAFYLWEVGLSKGNNQLLASLSFFTPVFSSVLLAIFGLAVWSINMITALALILIGAAITHVKLKRVSANSQKTQY